MSIYNQDYTNGTGFTYDSDKAEFSGGKVQQKADVPSDIIAYAKYGTDEDFDYSIGATTGTLVNNAAVVGGKLLLDNDDISYCTYDGSIVNASPTAGAIRFAYIPNHSSYPPSEIGVYKEINNSNNNNAITFRHATSGNVAIQFYDSSGVAQLQFVFLFLPTLGTSYDIEINFNTVTGLHCVYVDGDEKACQTLAYTRTGTIETISLGYAGANSNNSIDNFARYSAQQHTTGPYTPTDWSELSATPYPESVVALPLFTNTSAGDIQSYLSYTQTDENSPKMTLDGQYHNGLAWVTSDNTYAQASTKTEIDDNIDTLIAQETLQLKIIFGDSRSKMSVDITAIEYYVDPTQINLIGYLYKGVVPVEGSIVKLRPYIHGGAYEGVFQVYDWQIFDATTATGYFSEIVAANESGELLEIKILKQSYTIDLSSYGPGSIVDIADLKPKFVGG